MRLVPGTSAVSNRRQTSAIGRQDDRSEKSSRVGETPGSERRACSAGHGSDAGRGRSQQVADAAQPHEPDGYQKRMISIALTMVPHTAAAAAASRTSAPRKPQQMSRPSSSI